MNDFLIKISLVPKKEQVEVTDRPSDEDLSVLHEALEDRSMQILLSEKVQKLLPLRLETDRLVGGEQRKAILEIIPQGVAPLPSGQGWSLRGQSTSASDFAKHGDQERAPVAEIIVGSLSENDCFNVV